MTACEIRLHGCDDTTEFVLELTAEQTEVARRIAARSKEASEYSCQPAMTVTPAATEGAPE